MGAKITNEKRVLPLLARFCVNVALLPCPRITTELPKESIKQTRLFFRSDLIHSRCSDKNAREQSNEGYRLGLSIKVAGNFKAYACSLIPSITLAARASVSCLVLFF